MLLLCYYVLFFFIIIFYYILIPYDYYILCLLLLYTLDSNMHLQTKVSTAKMKYEKNPSMTDTGIS